MREALACGSCFSSTSLVSLKVPACLYNLTMYEEQVFYFFSKIRNYMRCQLSLWGRPLGPSKRDVPLIESRERQEPTLGVLDSKLRIDLFHVCFVFPMKVWIFHVNNAPYLCAWIIQHLKETDLFSIITRPKMEKQKIQTDEYYLQGAVIKGCVELIKVTDLVHFFCLLHGLLWGNATMRAKMGR